MGGVAAADVGRQGRTGRAANEPSSESILDMGEELERPFTPGPGSMANAEDGEQPWHEGLWFVGPVEDCMAEAEIAGEAIDDSPSSACRRNTRTGTTRAGQ